MSITPKRPCKKPGCTGLTTHSNGYCSECQTYVLERKRAASKAYNKKRDPIVKKWLNSSRYRNERKYFLNQNPLCVTCKATGKTTPANILDHMEPHKGNSELFWDQKNWQALCKRCHDRKTAMFDGAFGNPRVRGGQIYMGFR